MFKDLAISCKVTFFMVFTGMRHSAEYCGRVGKETAFGRPFIERYYSFIIPSVRRFFKFKKGLYI